MIHNLDTKRYKQIAEYSCSKNNVRLKEVNPFRTSKIGKEKYCDSKKLTVHQAASYVIARRWQYVERKSD